MKDRDNQQQTVSDFEIGWVAGFIDGEGSICLNIHKRKDRYQNIRITPKVIVTNTDKPMIEAYIDILKRLGIGRYVRLTKPNNKKVSELFEAQGKRVSFKDITWVYVEGFKRVIRFLSVIAPHLQGEKKLRSELLIKFISKRLDDAEKTSKASNYSYDEADVANVLEFLSLTKTPNYEKVAGMLNEHTREAKKEKRRVYRINYRLGLLG